MTVYLLHFERPINSGHPTQHYLGWTPLDIEIRLAIHRAGRGARLTQVANERRIRYEVARLWESGDRQLERRLKNQRNGPRLCPICNPDIASLRYSPYVLTPTTTRPITVEQPALFSGTR